MQHSIVETATNIVRVSRIRRTELGTKSFYYKGRVYDVSTNRKYKRFLNKRLKDINLTQKITPEKKLDGFINKFSFWEVPGESGIEIQIFKNDIGVLDEIYNNLNVDGDQWQSDYSPTGRMYQEAARIKILKDRIFFIQRAVMDC